LSDADMEARAARHQTLFQEVTRIIVGDLEDLEKEDEEAYTAVVDQVENDG
jgi:hypothetical protein